MPIITEPLRKVTINLYEKDMKWLQARYDRRISEIIRKAVRGYIIETKITEEDPYDGK